MHLYYSNIASLKLVSEINGTIPTFLENNLDNERKNRIRHIGNVGNRLRSAVAGNLIQIALRDYATGNGLIDENRTALPLVVDYGYGEYGKPCVNQYKDFHFSLSHSGNIVSLIYSDDEIGLDVQEHRVQRDIDRIAKRFFSPNEETYLEKISNKDINIQEFYKIWAAKEAYIKMIGKGLSADLSSFDIDLTNMVVIQPNIEKRLGYLFDASDVLDDVTQNYSLFICTNKLIKNIHAHEITFES